MIKMTKHRIIKVATLCLFPLIRIMELIFLFVYGRKKLKHQPIFIIGAPRTGSTILYQALTNYYEVFYVDNLNAHFYKNFFFGSWLSRFIYRNKPHDNFSSSHGNTASFGLHSPSECGSFWYRWLPRDKHFVDHGEISNKAIKNIRTEITAVINCANKPLVFKNLNAGQRLRLLKEAFPDAKFIFLKRDPRFVVNSIMNARNKVGCNPNEFWGIKPKNFLELTALAEADMCIAQVYYIEKQISEDLQLFNRKNVFEMHYEDLSPNTLDIIGEYFELKHKSFGSLPKFKKDLVEKIDSIRLNKIEETIKKYKFGDK